MNQVILEGRIVTELKKRSDKAPCEFRLETRDEWRGEKVEGKNNNQYHAIVVWGEKGNKAVQDFKRNDLVRIVGFLQHKLIEFNPKDEQGNSILKLDGSPLMIKTTVSEVKVKLITLHGSGAKKSSDSAPEVPAAIE